MTINAGKVRDDLATMFKRLDVPNRQLAAIYIRHFQSLGAWEIPILHDDLPKRANK